jgi:uncharacterized repeat protein (TIGR03803 family)
MRLLLPFLGARGTLHLALLICSIQIAAAQAAGPSLTTLYTFQNGMDGESPSGVVIGKDGVLYGTSQGGTNGSGTVFSLTPPGTSGEAWTQEVLYSFLGAATGDGAGPSGVVVGNGGVLYGTTSGGGTTGNGTVFSLAPPSSASGQWTETVLYSFQGGTSDGALPSFGVVIGKDGVLYGTTYSGGKDDGGTVFSLTPPAFPGTDWTEAVLSGFRFSGSPSALTIGKRGELYGTNTFANAAGTVFEVDPPSGGKGQWTETIDFSFGCQGAEGCRPYGSVVIGTGGVLYGTTEEGGANHTGGVVYSLSPPASTGAAWTETVLYNFARGRRPRRVLSLVRTEPFTARRLVAVERFTLWRRPFLPTAFGRKRCWQP